MDRELRVMQGGYELAELIYDYQTPTSGKVKMKINRIYDLGDDMKSFYPIYEYENYFNHGVFTSIDQLKAFDKELLRKERDFEEHMNEPLEYLYEIIEYRYVLTHRDVIGMANIKVDLAGNTREMQFISARRIKEDLNLSTTIFETHKALLTRICEEYLDCYGVDFKRLGWN